MYILKKKGLYVDMCKIIKDSAVSNILIGSWSKL